VPIGLFAHASTLASWKFGQIMPEGFGKMLDAVVAVFAARRANLGQSPPARSAIANCSSQFIRRRLSGDGSPPRELAP
jgi:hypothetical protein